MGDHHDHHHHHAHEAPPDFGRAFAIGVALNTFFVVVEVVYGFLANSISLVADAGHNLGDVLGLALAWGASVMSRRTPTEKRTYGFHRSSVLAAVVNAVVLLISVGAIAWEAVLRLINPEPATGLTMMGVAAVGVVINGLTALLFASGRKGDLNIRSAFMHMVSDAAISLGVVIAGLIVLKWNVLWIDPAVGIVISLTIVWGTWHLLKDSLNLALDAVPGHVDAVAVKEYLKNLPGVTAVHDLHIWGLSTTVVALTAHLVRNNNPADDDLLAVAAHELEHHFGIHHATIQLETEHVAAKCRLQPDEVV